MTVQWLTYAALLQWTVAMAVVAESSQSMREAMETDVAQDRASMVSAVREMQMTPRMLPHVSKLK